MIFLLSDFPVKDDLHKLNSMSKWLCFEPIELNDEWQLKFYFIINLININHEKILEFDIVKWILFKSFVSIRIDNLCGSITNTTTILLNLATSKTWQLEIIKKRSRQNQNGFLIIKDKLKNCALEFFYLWVMKRAHICFEKLTF